MTSAEISFAQFATQVDQFTGFPNGNAEQLDQSACRYFPDPPGEKFVADYKARLASHSCDAADAILHWELPPAPAQQSRTYLLRALLTHIGEEAGPRSTSPTLTRQISNLFQKRHIRLLIITGWHNLLTTKQKTVSSWPTTMMTHLIRFELPPTHVLAIGNLITMEQVFTSHQLLATAFHPLMEPPRGVSTNTTADDIAYRLLRDTATGEDPHTGEPDNEDIHQMLHQCQHAISAGETQQAETILAQAEQLAEQRGAQKWLAQLAETRGVMLNQSEQPEVAIPHFERALRIFEEHNITRMAVHTAVFFGNALATSGNPERALEVLQHAISSLESAANINPFESIELHFHLLLETGKAYRFLGRWDNALTAFDAALEIQPPIFTPPEIHRAQELKLQSLVASGRLREGTQFGETLMLGYEDDDTSDSWSFVASIVFELGIAYSQLNQPKKSLVSTETAVTIYHQLRELPEHDRGFAADPAMLGRLHVNMGSAYAQLRDYPNMLAHWRRGLDILQLYEAEDASIPRDLIAKIQTDLPVPILFQALLEDSEPIYQQLQLSDKESTMGSESSKTKLERAQTIIDQVEFAPLADRVAAAEQALSITPDCSGAYIILAEASDDHFEELEFLQSAVDAAARSLDPSIFTKERGHFASVPGTEPYLRACVMLAAATAHDGEIDEAIELGEDLLQLDPTDTRRIRHLLANWYIINDDDKSLHQLLRKFPDDPSLYWTYTRALDSFRRHGPTDKTNNLFMRALGENIYVPAYLLEATPLPDPTHVPETEIEHIQMDGAVYTQMARDAWEATEDALDWVSSMMVVLATNIIAELGQAAQILELAGGLPDIFTLPGLEHKASKRSARRKQPSDE